MTDRSSPQRRSGLEAAHARIGSGWPVSYGDQAGERRTVEEAVGLAEPGLYDKWLLRGPRALAALRATGLTATAGFVTAAPPGGINVWAIAADEAWLVASAPTPGGPQTAPVDVSSALDAARREGVTATDISSGWTVLRLFGPLVRDLLEELVAIDVAPSALADLAIAQLTIAGSRVILSRRDSEGIAGFTLLAARDEAESLWDALLHVGAPYGIRPVGAAALLPAGAPAGAGGQGGTGEPVGAGVNR
jgi:heterotetrameric sarcosine oxidase gamma subunit